jgi:hypothetical protein
MISPDKFLTVHSVALRPNMGPLKSLIDDARDSQPVLKVPEGVVYLKTPAFLYTPQHVMVIPDRKDKADAPGVADIEPAFLHDTFGVWYKSIEVMQEVPGTNFIDAGWNYSHTERKKRIASQPDTLHLHTIGYRQGDLRPISSQTVLEDPTLRSKLKEKADPISHDLLLREIIPATPDFKHFFAAKDGDPLRFDVRGGMDILLDPDFAPMMQALHRNGQLAYNKLAGCFFDLINLSQDRYGRNMPKAAGQRRADLLAYLSEHSQISAKSARRLGLLANMVVPFDELVRKKFRTLDATDSQVKDLLYLQGALNGMAYSVNFSAPVQDGKAVGWEMQIHPEVFSSTDLLQASSEFKLFERDENEALTLEQYSQAMQIEKSIRGKVKS